MGSSLATPKKQTPTESPTERLSTLSKGIDARTQILVSQLKSQGAEAPSFGKNGLAEFAPLDPKGEASQARRELLAMTQELRELVLGPKEVLKSMGWAVSLQTSFQISRRLTFM